MAAGAGLSERAPRSCWQPQEGSDRAGAPTARRTGRFSVRGNPPRQGSMHTGLDGATLTWGFGRARHATGCHIPAGQG